MSLSRWQRSIVTEAGDTIAEAEIEVFDAGESTKPDLFQDSDGSTALTNPFNADGSGFAAFYVAGGRYDIAVNGAVIWTNVALGTVQSRDVGTGSDQVPDNDTFGVTSSGVVPEMIGQGAIVDVIENSDGTAIRWESGVQVCFDYIGDGFDISGTQNNTSAQGLTIYRWTGVSFDYASDFAKVPYFDVSFRLSQENTLTSSIRTDQSLVQGQISIHSLEDETTDELRRVAFFAIGFWK